MRTTRNLVFTAVVGMSGVLFGCAANNASLKPEEFTAVFEQSTRSVETLLQQGNQKDALKLLDELAAKNPERKEPWARKAKIHFDAGSYAQAISSAEEVLQRDPSDRSAKSIRAVAGLRVATQSLNELRSDVELKGNARTDAIGLVKVMRETLGESVLVPPSASKAEAVGSRNAAATQRASQGRGRAGSRKPAAPAAAEAAPSGGDPFGALK